VRVPAGAKDGERIVLAGAGHAGGPGGPAGDVVVRLRVEPPEDTPGLRRAAAAGAALATLLLAVVVLVVFH
jgi:DnaJ-class molecular chaperone